MSTTDTGAATEPLSDPEHKLLSAAATGTLLDLRTGTAESDDPARGMNWGADRQVRAELLIELLTGTRPPDGGQLRAIKLRGARITGCLNLEAASLTCPLLLQDCHFDEPVNLDEATCPTIGMPGCHMPSLTAAELRITRGLALNAGFTATGGVTLAGARIGGELSMGGASLASTKGPALFADGLTVRYDVFIDDGFTATGEVNLNRARIGGLLRLSGARLTNPGMAALSGETLTVDRDMFCQEGFTATGEVRLPGAHIGGLLSLSGASLANPDGTALFADGLTVDQGMFCEDGFTATGEVRLPGAHIGGLLSLSGASLANPDGTALFADGLTADQGMFCENGFTATGEVRLAGAHIGGQLSLNGAKLTNPDGTALSADGLTVGSDMLCRDGFTVQGEVRLPGAHIGGQLILDGASLSNPGKAALTAEQLTVAMELSFEEEFTATGEVNLNRVRIGGFLSLNGAKLTNPGGTALSAEGLTVGSDMLCGLGFTATGDIGLLGASIGAELDLAAASLTNPAGLALDLETASIRTLRLPRERPDGGIDLTNAKVGVFVDDPESWPAVLYLRGFVYDSLENQDVSTRARLQWVKRHQGRFTPQLYDQLATTYRRAGDETAARKVAIAKQWRRRRAFNPLNWLWYATVGYGYRTWLAGVWLAALVGLGTWVFRGAYPAHMTAISSNPPPFHAPVYALDTLLPVIGLGQKTAWQPQGSAYLYWSWALTIAGWVLTTAVVAGLTGILKHD